jgi:hypothetical protein
MEDMPHMATYEDTMDAEMKPRGYQDNWDEEAKFINTQAMRICNEKYMTLLYL